jgi:membrane associated rhomboid family serine protease
MLLIPTSVEISSGALPNRSTPVVWIWLALVLAVFFSEQAVILDHDLGFHWLPRGLFAGTTFVVASWSLYGDPVLFDLWQLWSHLLIHYHWWLLAVEIVVMLVVGRALERVMGSSLFAAVLACLGPLGGVLMVLFGHESTYVGGLPLMLGLIGVMLGRLPGAMISWGIAWWAIIAVGYWPLFRQPVHMLMFLLLALTFMSAPAEAEIMSALTGLILVATGFGLGILVRRFDYSLS